MTEAVKLLLNRIDRLEEEIKMKAPKLIIENEIKLIIKAAKEVKKEN